MIQEILLGLSIVGAITFLTIRFWPKKTTGSQCASNCGCEPKKIIQPDT